MTTPSENYSVKRNMTLQEITNDLLTISVGAGNALL